ncbi:MAG: S41 family peptidase [Chitinophagales bacterium]
MNCCKILLLILIVSNYAFGQKNHLQTFSKAELLEDFDLMVNSLKEAHGGLYWYSNAVEFDSICVVQRNKIDNNTSSLAFYNLITPIITSIKEGHTNVSISKDISNHLKAKDLYLPILTKTIDGNLFLLNDIQKHKTKGYSIAAINGVPIETVLDEILNSIPADGYITTSKFYRLNSNGFSNYYSDLYDISKTNSLTLVHPNAKDTIALKNVKSIDSKSIRAIRTDCFKHRKGGNNLPLDLELLNKSTGLLRLNTFEQHRFEAERGFEKILDSLFHVVQKKNIEHLILDLRYNRGGEEHYSALTFSYLTDAPFEQYEYVQTNAFDYSFFEHTNYNSKENRDELLGYLNDEHDKAMDGRILRKKTVLPAPDNQENAFTGNIYVLTSGKTYSAAALFASLVRSHTNAVFVGQETGGCYYGNTGGFRIRLTLPNSKLGIDIPLLRFVNKVDNIFPLGRGIIPHHKVEQGVEDYILGNDKQLEFILNLIKNDMKQ